MLLKELKKTKQIYFKLVNKKGEASKSVYFINHYERSEKKYSISKFDDINFEKFVKPEQQITIDFEF